MTVTLKGGKKVTVLLGKKKGDDEFYVKTPTRPQVFLVKKFNLERVNKRPVDFRDKTLCDLADSDLTEVAVTHGDNSYTLVKAGNDWKATKPAKLELDPAKVDADRRRLQGLKATGFAEEPTPKTQRPRQAAGDHHRQGQDQGRRRLPAEGRRRDQGQAELLRRQRDQARRLPGAEVERRPHPGQDRRPQEEVEVTSRASHVDDDDAPLGLVVIVDSVLFAFGPVGLGLPSFVANRNLETRTLVTPARFLLAATDLFDDPRFEHGDENL